VNPAAAGFASGAVWQNSVGAVGCGNLLAAGEGALVRRSEPKQNLFFPTKKLIFFQTLPRKLGFFGRALMLTSTRKRYRAARTHESGFTSQNASHEKKKFSGHHLVPVS
jgi:hypothetical protein